MVAVDNGWGVRHLRRSQCEFPAQPHGVGLGDERLIVRRRLRKKLRGGEFPQYGFEVTFRLAERGGEGRSRGIQLSA